MSCHRLERFLKNVCSVLFTQSVTATPFLDQRTVQVHDLMPGVFIIGLRTPQQGERCDFNSVRHKVFYRITHTHITRCSRIPAPLSMRDPTTRPGPPGEEETGPRHERIVAKSPIGIQCQHRDCRRAGDSPAGNTGTSRTTDPRQGDFARGDVLEHQAHKPYAPRSRVLMSVNVADRPLKSLTQTTCLTKSKLASLAPHNSMIFCQMISHSFVLAELS